MKLPLSWLNEYVKVEDDPKTLADKLLNIGFEVEEIIYVGKGIENVVVGEIESVEKHPDATKLQVCNVNVGKEKLVIITGANNISVGDRVPIALDGANLPNGAHIVSSPLRGIMSYGMMCSGEELCIDDNVLEGAEVHGILILPKDAPIGEDIKKVLGLDEYVFDISVPANRPDCQSVYGMAREVAAIYGTQAKKPEICYKEVKTAGKPVKVTIEANDLCSAYTGRIVSDVKIEKSPKWMRDRLRYVGIRAINNVVDVTNYVLAEIGQPLHAFDLNLVKNEIKVRRAAQGEKIVALDGQAYALNEKMLVIADEAKPVAIAGIMGGEYSGINDDTHAVFLEAARFAKENIRATSRAIGLRSDSSARYEKGVDFNSVELGRERALTLFDKLGAGRVTSLFSRGGEKEPELKVIETTVDKINELFGITVKAEDMVRILTSLEFGVKRDGNVLTVTVPKFREDVDNYTDLAEEVIRFYGYSALTEDFIKFVRPTVGGVSVSQKNVSDIKNLMTAYGALEAYNYSFINVKQYDKLRIAAGDPRRNVIRIINPLSEEFGVMRTQLVGSMLNSVYINTSRKNNEFRLFEIAKTYIPKSLPLTELPEEHDTLCVAFVGKHEDFYALKSVIANVLKNRAEYVVERSCEPFLHSGISIDLIANGKKFGYVGKVHPLVAENFGIPEDVFVAEVDLSGFIADPEKIVRFKPLPKFPIVDRDLAVTVKEEHTVGELIACIKESIGNLCDSVELFDVYRGEQVESGYKSVAFSIKLYSDEKTLVDAQIQECMNKAVEGLGKKFGAKLR